jgi:hypothetical protein
MNYQIKKLYANKPELGCRLPSSVVGKIDVFRDGKKVALWAI